MCLSHNTQTLHHKIQSMSVKRWPSLSEYEEFEKQVLGAYGSSPADAMSSPSTIAERHDSFYTMFTNANEFGPLSGADAKQALLKVLSDVSEIMKVHYTALMAKAHDQCDGRTSYISADSVLEELGLVGLQAAHTATLKKCMADACAKSSLECGAAGWRNDSAVLHVPRKSLDAVRNAVYYECYLMIKEGCAETAAASPNAQPGGMFTGVEDELMDRIRVGDVLDSMINDHPELMGADADMEDKIKMKTGYLMSRFEMRAGKKRKRDEEGQRVYTAVDAPQLKTFAQQAIKMLIK